MDRSLGAKSIEFFIAVTYQGKETAWKMFEMHSQRNVAPRYAEREFV